MGGKSSSSSSSNSEQVDQRVGAEGESIAVGGEASIVINAESPEAFELVRDVVTAAGEIFNANIEFAQDIQTNSQAQWMKSLEIIDTATRDDETKLSESAMKLAVPLAAIYAIAKVMK